MITDCHIHLLPERLARAIREFFTWADLAYPSTDPATVLGALAEAGVTSAWNLPYARRPGTAEALNAWSGDLAAAVPDPRVEVVGGATVHPGDEHPEAMVGRAVDDLGLRVLKLHCSVGDYDADDERLDPVWDLAARRGVPVVVHVGHSVFGSTEQHEVGSVDRVAARHPGARIVVAHTAQPATAAAVALFDRHPNVHADLTPRVTDAVEVDDEVLAHYVDRFLLGTDAPNTAISAEQCIARLAVLDAAGRDQVLHGNAARLLLPA